MLVGVWKDSLIARLGPKQGDEALLEPHVKVFDITGRPMKTGFLSSRKASRKTNSWEKHIGLYPPISGDKTLEKAVAPYAGPKGNLQFPLGEPIPYDLIERIVKLRVKQDSVKAAAKRKKRK